MLLKFTEYPPHLHFTIPALALMCVLSAALAVWFFRHRETPTNRRIAAAALGVAAISGCLWLISVWNPEMIW